MSSAFQEHVPFRRRHAEQASSFHAKSAKAKNITVRTLKVDSLQDKQGNEIFTTSSRQLSESSSQDSPGAGNGLYWVRDDAPAIAVFTNDAGTVLDLTQVTVAEVLATGNNAGDQSMDNLSSVSFNGGVNIGSGTNTTNNAGVSIGTSSLGVNNCVTIGTACIAYNFNAVAIGKDTSTVFAAGVYNGVSVGVSAKSSGNGISIGKSVDVAGTVTGGQTVLIGNTVVSAGNRRGVALGSGNEVDVEGITLGASAGNFSGNTATNSICIGYIASSTSTNTISIGSYTYANADQAISIGYFHTTGTARSTTIGYDAQSSAGQRSVVIGARSEGRGTNDVIVGGTASSAASSSNSVVLGFSSSADVGGANQTVLGAYVGTESADEMALNFHFKQIYDTVTTTSAGPTDVIGFSFNTFWKTARVDCTVVGRNTGGGTGFSGHTYMFSLKYFHFNVRVNGTGTLEFFSDNEQITSNIDHQEITQVDMTGTFASKASRAGGYLLLYSANDATKYYLWNDTTGDGSTNDPAVNEATGIAVNTSAAGTDIAMAQALETALAAYSADFTVSRVDEVVTITTAELGNVTDTSKVSWNEVTLTTINRDPSVTLTAVGNVAQVRVSQSAGDEIAWSAVMQVYHS